MNVVLQLDSITSIKNTAAFFNVPGINVQHVI